MGDYEEMQVPETFESDKAEAAFWKEVADRKQEEIDELHETYMDMTESSKELEAELERELEQREAQAKELARKYDRMRTNYERVQASLKEMQSSTAGLVDKLRTEVTQLRDAKEKSEKLATTLEIDNEQLGNRERMLASTVDNLRDQLDGALERAIMLQHQVEEEKEAEEREDAALVRDLQEQLRGKDEELRTLHTRLQQLNERSPRVPGYIEERRRRSSLGVARGSMSPSRSPSVFVRRRAAASVAAAAAAVASSSGTPGGGTPGGGNAAGSPWTRKSLGRTFDVVAMTESDDAWLKQMQAEVDQLLQRAVGMESTLRGCHDRLDAREQSAAAAAPRRPPLPPQ